MKTYVLCIDKDPSAKEVYNTLLDYKFYYAKDLLEGYKILEKHKKINTIIIDDLIDNPILVFQHLKRKYKEKKILLITEKKEQITVIKMDEILNLIEPPFDLESVKKKLDH